ncbi:MAG TPA: hypothetical protein VLD86_12650 [Ilumatobacteraceae bacterium]|nr:hypothetical protein [Ilumatobacteraceae bacterium]
MKAARRTALLVCVVVSTVLIAPSHSGAVPTELNPVHAAPTRGYSLDSPPAAQASKGPARRGNGINYNGGPVMVNTTHTYVVWYGSWTPAKTSIITSFLDSIGGSPYFNINTTYYDAAQTKVRNSVTNVASTIDNYSQGASNLSDTAIKNIVAAALNSGRLPADPDGVYFVLTSSDVSKSGFLTSYCGWHTYATIASTNIKYSFVGDPTGPQVSSCSAQTAASPNGDVGADAMISVIAHELEEAVTDPNLNAWYDNRGYENADKCAWTFGTTYTTTNGSKANMNLGGNDYLIQRNWVNASGGYCALAY